MKSFTFIQPSTIEEACTLLKQYGSNAKLIAGGTDLIVQMRAGKVHPDYVIGINKVGMNKIVVDHEKGNILIGACVTNADVAASPEIRSMFPAIAESCESIGGRQTRNLGTIGGNICNASPAADSAPSLMVFDAKVEVIFQDGKYREVAITDFFYGPGKIILNDGELVTGFKISLPKDTKYSSAFIKLGKRKAMEIATVNAAVYIEAESQGHGVCKNARIASGAVGPVPMLLTEASRSLIGKQLNEQNIENAATIAATSTKPITDFRSSEDYRREMVKVLVRRALISAATELTSY